MQQVLGVVSLAIDLCPVRYEVAERTDGKAPPGAVERVLQGFIEGGNKSGGRK